MARVPMLAAVVAVTIAFPAVAAPPFPVVSLVSETVRAQAGPPPEDGAVVDGSIIMVHAPVGDPFHVDTTALPGPHLNAWWFDPSTGKAIDAGSVRRAVRVPFFPPDTGAGDRARGWVLVIDDVARSTDPAARRPTAIEIAAAEIDRR
jgi:hypothetical protein